MHGKKKAATRKASGVTKQRSSTCLCYVIDVILLPCVPLYPMLFHIAGRHSHPHAIDAREEPPVLHPSARLTALDVHVIGRLRQPLPLPDAPAA